MVNFKDNTDKWRSILDLTYEICQIIDHDFLCKLPEDKTYHEEIQSSVYVLFTTGLDIGILPPNIVPLRSGARSFVRSESEKDQYVNELLEKVNKILLKVKHIEKERVIKMDKKYNGVKLITSLDTYLYKDTLNKSVRSANSCFKFRLQTPIKYKILEYNKLYYNIVKDLTFKFRENNNTVEELIITFKKGVDKSTANDIGQIIRYIIIQDILPTDVFTDFYIEPIEVQNGDNMRGKKEKENKIKDMKSKYVELTYEDFYDLLNINKCERMRTYEKI